MNKELRDQSAHFAVAVVILAIPALLGWLGGALAGFLIGLVREVTEEGAPVTLAKIAAADRAAI